MDDTGLGRILTWSFLGVDLPTRLPFSENNFPFSLAKRTSILISKRGGRELQEVPTKRRTSPDPVL